MVSPIDEFILLICVMILVIIFINDSDMENISSLNITKEKDLTGSELSRFGFIMVGLLCFSISKSIIFIIIKIALDFRDRLKRLCQSVFKKKSIRPV